MKQFLRYRWLFFVVAGLCLLPLTIATENATVRVILVVGIVADFVAAVGFWLDRSSGDLERPDGE